MRFGKRRDKEAPEGNASAQAATAPEPNADDWIATGHDAGREADPSTPLAPAVEPEPVATESEAEAVVEGEAVELPYEPPVAVELPPEREPQMSGPGVPAYEPPGAHPVDPGPAARLADSTPHHEPGINPGPGGAWPEPAFDLAERPEILVGAAFGGGFLLALILRRLGN